MEIQFEYIVSQARQYNGFSENPQLLYQAINALPEAIIKDIFTEYGVTEDRFQPVNALRAEVARQLRAGMLLRLSVGIIR